MTRSAGFANRSTVMSYLEFLNDILNFAPFSFGGTPVTIANILKLIAWIIAVVLIERAFRSWVLVRVLSRTQLVASSRFAIGRIFGYLFLTVGIYLGFQFAGIDVSSFALLAGAVGVGIGFGLQNIVSNFVCGLIILAERPIALEDRVQVAGVEGNVRHISLRSTTVVTNDNISIIVPNTEFISGIVVNWSHGDPKVRIRLPLGVAYGSDVEKLRELMREVALAHPEVLREPAPQLFFTGFGESSLDFELGIWTLTQNVRPLRLKSDLYFAIEKCLRENGIEIPFPQRDLHIRSGRVELGGAVETSPSSSSRDASRK
jgi:small-conductance mechanosensitive channel